MNFKRHEQVKLLHPKSFVINSVSVCPTLLFAERMPSVPLAILKSLVTNNISFLGDNYSQLGTKYSG